jgi:hypothetical protein
VKSFIASFYSALRGDRGSRDGVERPLMADTVAKVFLHRPRQIFRAVGAAIE